MTDQKHSETSPCINVTPLIDVLLVLLIIFMVASPLKPGRFKALIPEPFQQKDEIPASDRNLRVDLSSDEHLKLNGVEEGSLSDPEKLIEALSTVILERTEKRMIDPQTGLVARTVFIKAPRSIRYGDVARVIDSVKTAGAEPVGLQIDELDQ